MAKREALLTKAELIEQLQHLLVKMQNECTKREVEGRRDHGLEALKTNLDTIVDAATE